MKKKILSFLLATAMIVSICSGCSSNSKENVQTDETSAVVTDAAEAPTTEASATEAPAKADPVELTVWGWDASFNGLALQEADALYDGATVNFVEMAKADCLQKIHTALASGQTDGLPDIVIIGDLSAQGYLMSYPGAFKAMDDIINYDDFASYKKAAVTYDGVGYGVPFDTGVCRIILPY